MQVSPRASWSHRTVALALSWGLLLGPSLAWAAPANGGPEIHFTTLASGQQVYVAEIHTQPIVTIDTWVNTGSAQETAQNNGVSHFLEHLLFKGTDKYQVGEIDKTLESRGAEFNAATSNDFTHYHITTATPYLQEALDLHADMLLNATISPPELDRERKVVQEEINRALDNPSRKTYLTMEKHMFGTHPYAMDTLGPKSNIQNIPREDILAYYHRWYQPENFKTIVAGDVSAEQASQMVYQAFEKAYRTHPHPQAGEPQRVPVAALTHPTSEVLADANLSAVQIELGFLAPPVTQREDNYALDLAAIILGQGESSRLIQVLKEKKQLVSDASASNSTQQQSGVFILSAEAKPENREAAKRSMMDVLNQFKATGPTPEEVQKAKTQIVKSFAFLNESTGGVAESVGYNVTIGTLDDYTDYVGNIQKITPQQVQAATQKYLDLNRAVLVESVPGGAPSTQLATEAQDNIALLQQAPKTLASNAAPALNTAGITEVKLPNGATLLLKPSPATQTVALNLMAQGGRLVEAKPGVGALTSQLLLKGTHNRSAEALSAEIEREGLNLNTDSDEDYFQVTASATANDLSKLLLILQDVLVNPSFPQDELDKERANMLEALKTSRDQPSSLMFEKLTEALYPHHPYGAVGTRLEASLPQVSREDVVRFYRDEMQPHNLVISVVGNFDPASVQAALQQILTALPADTSPKTAKSLSPGHYPEVSPLKAPVMVEAQKPEQAATWMAYGWLAPGIASGKDYATLKTINTLLGSGLSSRLFVDLREKQGLAYHVSSMYPSTLKPSRFVMYIGTDPRNQQQVTEGFDTEIHRIETEKVSPEELARVKSKLIGQFALAHESNASQAFYLSLFQTLGVGYQFDTRYPEQVQAVTAEDIQRVGQTIFGRPKVTTIVSPKLVRTGNADEALPHAD